MFREKLILTGLICASSTVGIHAQPPANPNGWDVAAGGGALDTARSLGSRKRHVEAVPTFNVHYKDWFFASPIQGVGVQDSAHGIDFSAGIGVDINSRDPKAGGGYADLSKIGLAPALKLRASYKHGSFSTETMISSRIASSSKGGTTLTIEEGYQLFAGPAGILTVGVKGRLMDDTFARNFLSISATDAANSGLQVYRAKSGLLDAGLFAQAVYPINRSWTIFSKASIDTLEGDARKSPLDERRTSPTFLMVAIYHF